MQDYLEEEMESGKDELAESNDNDEMVLNVVGALVSMEID